MQRYNNTSLLTTNADCIAAQSDFYVYVNIVRIFESTDYWKREPSAKQSFLRGPPDRYRPIVQFQSLDRILWRKFHVLEVWTRSVLLPTSSDLFAAAATNRRSTRSGANTELWSDSYSPPCQGGVIVSPTLYQLSYPGDRYICIAVLSTDGLQMPHCANC